MSKTFQTTPAPRKGLNDPRSTGAAPPLRRPEVNALRGTFKGR